MGYSGNLLPVVDEPILLRDPAQLPAGFEISPGVSTGEADWALERAESEQAFHDQLVQIGGHVPEAVTEAERITTGARQLIEAFGVKPEFFKDRNRSTIFASLALSAAKVEEAKDQNLDDRKAIEQQQLFVASAAFLLTRKYAGAFPELAAEHEAQVSEGHDGMHKSVIDKFEQPELTRALRSFIDREGILDELRTKFKGIGGAEPEYHVLSIGNGTAAFHFDHEANGVSPAEAKAWTMGLELRADEFAKSVPWGELATKASGFAVEFNDAQGHHVYIPGPSAELLMAEERGIVPNKAMAQLNGNGRRTKGTIRHEYVHTRDGLVVEEEFGKSIEERRAEYFSGDTGEYFEVKRFFTHLRVLHGHSITDIFEEHLQSAHSDDPVSVYELIGKYYGLEMVAAIASAQPDAYVKHTKSTYTKDMLDSIGGYSAIIERDAGTPSVNQDSARERLSIVVNMLRRGNVAADGSLNQDYDSFLQEYFGTVSRALSKPISDIPFVAAK